MSFKENLESLPEIDGVAKVILYDSSGFSTGEIPNEEGTSGSCRVYAFLVGSERKEIDEDLAIRGLRLFSEYTSEAEKDENSHPNIQELFGVVRGNYLEAEVIMK